MAKAVNQRQAEESWQLFAEYDDIRVLPLFRPGEANNQQVVDFAVELIPIILNLYKVKKLAAGSGCKGVYVI